MRQLIGRRGDTPRNWTRTQTVYDTPTKAEPSSKMNDPTSSIEPLINEVDTKLMRAASYQTALQSDLKEVSNNLKEVSRAYIGCPLEFWLNEITRNQLNSKRPGPNFKMRSVSANS